MIVSNLALLIAASTVGLQHGDDVAPAPTTPDQAAPLDWRSAEAGVLANHVQLTTDDMFVKAGEAYFNPEGTWIIFQAIPTPEEGQEPDEFYSMYVAQLKIEDGRVTGLEKPVLVSLPGSANTCGWFNPVRTGYIIFGSTMEPPTPMDPPGFQRESSTYKWMFPQEMEIVSRRVISMTAKGWGFTGRITENPHPNMFTTITEHEGYDAECALSPDGRHMIYASMRDETNLCDLYIFDTRTGETRPVIERAGYDGGPFFSPDGKRICYRSDRRGDNLLQIYVADLNFDPNGFFTGVGQEYQLTDDQNVNWAPFWHPGGRHLVYTTSALGHHNYEVFIMDADSGTLEGSTGSIKYGLNKRRITHAAGFDGLPAFSNDGKRLMWTSQRGESGSSQLWIADFVMPLQ